jgi:signal transduction histidine kinase
MPGHGLGLAMVRDMAGLYGGRLELGESALGGARVELRLPGRLA